MMRSERFKKMKEELNTWNIGVKINNTSKSNNINIHCNNKKLYSWVVIPDKWCIKTGIAFADTPDNLIVKLKTNGDYIDGMKIRISEIPEFE